MYIRSSLLILIGTSCTSIPLFKGWCSLEIKITEGPNLDKVINDCYQYLFEVYRREKAEKNDSSVRKGIDGGAIEGVQRGWSDR